MVETCCKKPKSAKVVHYFCSASVDGRNQALVVTLKFSSFPCQNRAPDGIAYNNRCHDVFC